MCNFSLIEINSAPISKATLYMYKLIIIQPITCAHVCTYVCEERHLNEATLQFCTVRMCRNSSHNHIRNAAGQDVLTCQAQLHFIYDTCRQEVGADLGNAVL